ncbi:hypothetical protein PHMEG_0003007 [Phytophthora megakarya]|uniref:Uncharacterized protein n=1 Tax=Phytophthora megakarya TaxID=4795 RepID=A0A225WX80_9STRA|nr:hypothetical protein PHMEG_0003007 [Phytophthora megakarya]
MHALSIGNSEAIRLAQASDWKGLQRLLERDPAMAKQRGDHGMLPIHWVCTVRRVPLSLVAKLLQAYPDGVRVKNAGELLPLHIAIRAGVQVSCLRKLVRAYPDAVSERTPDGVSALELAEDVDLDADSLKVLHRAVERKSITCSSTTQQNDDSSYEESAQLDRKRVLSGQEEGEASGVERPEDEEDKVNWTDAVPEPYVGNVGFGGFLHIGDDGELDATDMSVLHPEDSISMMSEQSLSDVDGLDSPHDHLVSPSSTSTCSQDEQRTSISSRSSFGARFRTGSRGPGGFQSQDEAARQEQTRLHRSASLLAQLQDNGILSEHELRTMISAMSVNAAVNNTDEAASNRNHSRHLSLPLMPSQENLQQNSNFQFYDEADDENEREENDNGSSRDSTSTTGGTTSVQFNPREVHHRCSGGHAEHHTDLTAEAILILHLSGSTMANAPFAARVLKISMETKGFTTPQRVCVTCYAMITHSRSLKHDLELEEMGHEGSLLNSVAFQQQHYAHTTGGNDRHASPLTSFPSSTAPATIRSTAFGTTRSPTTSADGTPTTSPTTGRKGPRKSNVLAAGEATGGAGERATTSNHATGTSSPVHELHSLLASQQKQIEQLAQSNMQMQQQLLEQEEQKAETMLLITQLMTRVSVLELQKDRGSRNSKRRSAGTGESEDEDEEFPQDDDTSPFER